MNIKQRTCGFFWLCFLPGALALLIACRKHYKCSKIGPQNIDQLLHFWLSKRFALISFANSIYCHSGLAFQLWSSITASTHHLELAMGASQTDLICILIFLSYTSSSWPVLRKEMPFLMQVSHSRKYPNDLGKYIPSWTLIWGWWHFGHITENAINLSLDVTIQFSRNSFKVIY